MGTHRGAKNGRDRDPAEFFRCQLMRNETRQRIVRLLEQRPGMNKHQLSVALGMRPNAIRFHVGLLEVHGLVALREAVVDPREALCFTEKNVSLWENPKTRVLFGRGVPKRVASYLAQHPGATVREVSEGVHLSVHTVRRHLRVLQDAKLVQRMHVYQGMIYVAEPELVEALRDAGSLDEPSGANAR